MAAAQASAQAGKMLGKGIGGALGKGFGSFFWIFLIKIWGALGKGFGSFFWTFFTKIIGHYIGGTLGTLGKGNIHRSPFSSSLLPCPFLLHSASGTLTPLVKTLTPPKKAFKASSQHYCWPFSPSRLRKCCWSLFWTLLNFSSSHVSLIITWMGVEVSFACYENRSL